MINYILQMLLALALGGLIGLERERQEKPAGLRDVMLVTLGATLFTIISIVLRETTGLGTTLRYDISRVISQIITSIGFLGGGIILFYRGSIEGVTTAAVLWVAVAVGILIGLNQPILATISAGAIYFTLKLKYIDIKFFNGRIHQLENGKKK